jgi:hypothetical protein
VKRWRLKVPETPSVAKASLLSLFAATKAFNSAGNRYDKMELRPTRAPLPTETTLAPTLRIQNAENFDDFTTPGV